MKFNKLILFCIALLPITSIYGGVLVFQHILAKTPVTWSSSPPPPVMKGDVLWNGVPSMVWGSNDTQIWDGQYSIMTERSIRTYAQEDHLALMRVWLFQYDLATRKPETDTYQADKVNASFATKAKLLCVLPTDNTMSYDEHLVLLFKGKCSYYEFMNEPDYEQIPIKEYISEWTSEIPKLRAIDTRAGFGGPTTAGIQFSSCDYLSSGTVCYMQKILQGMAKNKVFPDFISFHWYPCWDNTPTTCLANASSIKKQIQTVRKWTRQYFGKAGDSIPIGITEWNADPSAPMPSYTSDICWMENFTTTAIESIAAGGASFANHFDLADAAGYGTDDMVDVYHNGKIRPQYYALLQVMNLLSPQQLPMPPLDFTQPKSCKR